MKVAKNNQAFCCFIATKMCICSVALEMDLYIRLCELGVFSWWELGKEDYGMFYCMPYVPPNHDIHIYKTHFELTSRRQAAFRMPICPPLYLHTKRVSLRRRGQHQRLRRSFSSSAELLTMSLWLEQM